MPKMPQTAKMVRVAFTLKLTEKEQWVKKAKEIGRPLAVLVKEAMNQHLYKPKKENNSNISAEIIEKFRNEIKESNKQYFARIEELIKENENLRNRISLDFTKMKNKTLILLRNGSMGRAELEEVLELDGMDPTEFRKQYRRLLKLMRKQKVIDFNLETKMWCIK